MNTIAGFSQFFKVDVAWLHHLVARDFKCDCEIEFDGGYAYCSEWKFEDAVLVAAKRHADAIAVRDRFLKEQGLPTADPEPMLHHYVSPEEDLHQV